jgi:RimJ/RimL family protein N-acetyltransferase
LISIRPVELSDGGVRLEPMRLEHEALLAEAASDGRLWELWYTSVPEPERVGEYVRHALARQADGHMLPWVVRESTTGDIVGSTRYHDVLAAADRVEIGYTWY